MSSSSEVGFQTLKAWYDAAEFAGRIVAYKTESKYFGAAKGYNQGETHFGYVEEKADSWGGGETGFKMIKLLKLGEIDSSCALIGPWLKSPISMKLATGEEIGFIRRAIVADQAKFLMRDGKEKNIAILERSLRSNSSLSSVPFGISCVGCKERLAAPVISLPECQHAFHKACYDSAMGQEHRQ